jgi:hypothetical protein
MTGIRTDCQNRARDVSQGQGASPAGSDYPLPQSGTKLAALYPADVYNRVSQGELHEL